MDTQVPLAGSNIHISVTELNGLRGQLLEYLQQSQLGDREALIPWTRNAMAEIDAEGNARLGAWRVQPQADGGLILAFRLVTTPHLLVIYRASAVRDQDTWRITNVGPLFVHAKHQEGQSKR